MLDLVPGKFGTINLLCIRLEPKIASRTTILNPILIHSFLLANFVLCKSLPLCLQKKKALWVICHLQHNSPNLAEAGLQSLQNSRMQLLSCSQYSPDSEESTRAVCFLAFLKLYRQRVYVYTGFLMMERASTPTRYYKLRGYGATSLISINAVEGKKKPPIHFGVSPSPLQEEPTAEALLTIEAKSVPGQNKRAFLTSDIKD